MIRNIPNRYSQENLMNILDINYKGLYDFLYMPSDNQVRKGLVVLMKILRH